MPPIRATIEAPVLTCRSCATIQLRNDKVGLAMLAAFIRIGWRRKTVGEVVLDAVLRLARRRNRDR